MKFGIIKVFRNFGNFLEIQNGRGVANGYDWISQDTEKGLKGKNYKLKLQISLESVKGR